MIYYEYTITVSGGTSKLNKDIYLYKNNRNIDYYFDIKEAQFNFSEQSIGDITQYVGATEGQLKLMKSDGTGKKLMTGKIPVSTASTRQGMVHFRILEELIDEDVEIGDYDFQIDLFDDEDGRITIPPVLGQLHILDPIFDDGEQDENYSN